MPTAVWSGTISFSLVSVPVQLFSASEDHDIRFHQYHVADAGRVRMRRICEVDREELDFTDIARGYEAGADIAIITDRDLDGLPEVAKKVVTIEAFVPEDQIDPIQYRSSYFVVPQTAGIRPYVLLRDALRKAGRAAVTRFAMRDRESLALLRARDDVVVLETLYWPDEVRAVPFEAPEAVEKGPELTAMTQLVKALADDFHPEKYTDHYQAELQAIIDAKIEGREIAHAPAAAEPQARVVDLLTALRQSVEAAKKTRVEEEKPATRRRRAS